MIRSVVSWMVSNHEAFNFYSPQNMDDIIKSHETNSAYYAFTDNYFFSKLTELKSTGAARNCPEGIMHFVNQLYDYKVLNIKKECVFAGDLKQQADNIKKTPYSRIVRRNYNQSLLVFSSYKLTDHIPLAVFEKRFDKYNRTHSNELNRDKYFADRLMDGLAVIHGDGEEAPCLLIDSTRSNLVTMYGLRYGLIREYEYQASINA